MAHRLQAAFANHPEYWDFWLEPGQSFDPEILAKLAANKSDIRVAAVYGRWVRAQNAFLKKYAAWERRHPPDTEPPKTLDRLENDIGRLWDPDFDGAVWEYADWLESGIAELEERVKSLRV